MRVKDNPNGGNSFGAFAQLLELSSHPASVLRKRDSTGLIDPHCSSYKPRNKFRWAENWGLLRIEPQFAAHLNFFRGFSWTSFANAIKYACMTHLCPSLLLVFEDVGTEITLLYRGFTILLCYKHFILQYARFPMMDECEFGRELCGNMKIT